MKELIEAGPGKIKKKRRVDNIPYSVFMEGVIDLNKRTLGLINPFKQQKYVNRLAYKLDVDGEILPQGFGPVNFTFKVSDRSEKKIGEILNPFKGGKYDVNLNDGDYIFTTMYVPRYPGIELVRMKIASFNPGPINSEERDKKYWLKSAHQAPLPDDMTLFILFKKLLPEAHIRYGLMLPLTICDSALPENLDHNYGHAIEIQFSKLYRHKEYIVHGKYFNFYDFSSSFENGLKIALNHHEKMFRTNQPTYEEAIKKT